MSKIKLLAGLAVLVALAACDQPGYGGNGYGRSRPISANCAALGAVGGAALGAATKNNIAESAIVGGVGGALAGNAGLCN